MFSGHEVEVSHGAVIATLPNDCRPVPGAKGAHCFTLALDGATSKVTVRVRDKIFYIVKADQSKFDASDGPETKVDAKGGATVSWKKFDKVEAAWCFVKQMVKP